MQPPVGTPIPGAAVLAHIPIDAGPTLLAISPDGTRLFAGGTTSLSVVDTASRRVVNTLRTDADTTGIAASADGKRVYINHLTNNRMDVFDPAAGIMLTPIGLIPNLALGGYGRIALSRNGQYAYLANGQSQVLLIVNLDDSDTTNFQVDMAPADVALSPDDAQLYVVGCKGFCVPGNQLVIDTGTRQLQQTFAVGPSPYRILVAPDGTRGFVANLAGPNVMFVDLPTRSVTATFTVPSQPTGLALSPDGKQLFVVSQNSGTLTIIDTTLGLVRGTVQVGSHPREAVLSPDGRVLYVSLDREIMVVDVAQWPGLPGS